ncbi:14036_t:CDS:2 [Rhizophagus irregularis]|nr:14036_t:CDS:2 [Rhizophagus irregularis]
MTKSGSGISFFGSVALLISSMTGPGLVTIPLLFQTAGWLIPVITFVVATVLSGAASLFLCEALSSVSGNNKFQKQVEFSQLSSILVTNKYYKNLIQTGLFISMQSFNIASIILSAQTMDSLVISIIGKTCGIGIHPDAGFFCVNRQKAEGSPFEERYMLLTAGYLIALCITVPMGIMDLVENIKVQIISLMTLTFIVLTWLVTFVIHGLDAGLVPMIGYDKSQVIGTVLFNYAFIITIPSWVNDVNPSVPIRKAVWFSVITSTIVYLLLGIMGGMAYKMGPVSNIISTVNESPEKSIISIITTYLFPLAALTTSIPVYTIIIRYNLLRTGYCGKVMANLLSCALPWIIIIPFQTGFWLNAFINWASLIFSSSYDIVKVETGGEKPAIEIEKKKSGISDTISIKSMNNWPSLPIVVSPPSPNEKHLLPPISHSQLLENNPIRKKSHESIQTTRTSLSIRTYRSSPKISPKVSPKVSPIIISENHPGGNYFDLVVINTSNAATETTTQHEIESEKTHHQITSANYLDIPIPQLILSGDHSPCSTPVRIRSHSTMTADYNIHHNSSEKQHLSAPPSLISRNSLKRRRSPHRHVITPIITLNNSQLDSNVDPLDTHFRQRFCHHHPSIISSDNTCDNSQKSDLNNYNFKAFPWISEISGMKIAIGCSAISIMLVGGIIIYDLILLALGTNVFSIHHDTS